MSLIVICLVALLASGLTFFSGFGLGTLLLPAFALFFPVEQAVAMTGVVHLLNGLFKLGLVGRKAHRGVLVRFGLPALVASFVGALVLVHLADVPPIASYTVFGALAVVTPVKLAIGGLLLAFAALELSERFGRVAIPPAWLPVGGLLSGFFGGLAGMQGALRSAFLVRAGLGKEAFIGTGVAIAVLIDLSRIGVYGADLRTQAPDLDYPLLAAAVVSASAGAYLGNRHLKKLTMAHVQRMVSQDSAHSRQAFTHSSMPPIFSQLSAQSRQTWAQSRQDSTWWGEWLAISAAAARQISAQPIIVRKCSGSRCSPPVSRHVLRAVCWQWV